MCRGGSTLGSVTHIGWLSPNGIFTMRRRIGGSRLSRARVPATKESKSRCSDGYRIAIFNVCMCTVGVSR